MLKSAESQIISPDTLDFHKLVGMIPTHALKHSSSQHHDLSLGCMQVAKCNQAMEGIFVFYMRITFDTNHISAHKVETCTSLCKIPHTGNRWTPHFVTMVRIRCLVTCQFEMCLTLSKLLNTVIIDIAGLSVHCIWNACNFEENRTVHMES